MTTTTTTMMMMKLPILVCAGKLKKLA